MPAVGKKPAAKGAKISAELKAAIDAAEREHLGALRTAYERAIVDAAEAAAQQFALTAAADWQPPVEGAALTATQLAAIAEALRRDITPIWQQIMLDVAGAPLARIGIAWDVKHPLAAGQLEGAAQRTGRRLGEAVQPVLRATIADAYERGLGVPETAALIRSEMTAAAPWQADMLARTDLNSLANGASRAAGALTGMQFKTWLATLDDKTRPEHVDAHGQVVPINDPFIVGGEDAQYPGDPALSDAMAANCRCTLAYGETLDEAEALLADGGGTMAGMRAHAKRQARRKQMTTKSAELAAVGTPAQTAWVSDLAFEGTATDDRRYILPNALSWRDVPLTLMAMTETGPGGHEGAFAAGKIETIRKDHSTDMNGDALPAGVTAVRSTGFFDMGGANGSEIARLVNDEIVRGVSVDLAIHEFAFRNEETGDIIEQEDAALEEALFGDLQLAVRDATILAATVCPTPAFANARIAIVASAEGQELRMTIWAPIQIQRAITASAAPVAPPRAWFETPEPPGKMPLTVMDDGRVFGHIATWDSCHVGFLPQCVPPPRSDSNYAYFHACELDCDDGETVTVGKLMFSPTDGGHADRKLSAAKASAYYDRTGMAAAYLRVSDGEHGIWAAGSLNPRMTDGQRQEMRRELRLHPPSGDWRPINGQYELICALAVAVPGFPTPRATITITAAGDELVLEDAIIASSGVIEADPEAVEALEEIGLVDAEMRAEAEMRDLASQATWRNKLSEILKGG